MKELVAVPFMLCCMKSKNTVIREWKHTFIKWYILLIKEVRLVNFIYKDGESYFKSESK
jgi:hypothetical protein